MTIRQLLCASTIVLSGCTAYSHTNVRQPDPVAEQTRATFNVTTDRGRDDTLFILAFSGGGSRAAYWSASVMLKLQQLFAAEGMNMLDQVDAISSVSGGSLPAAYYAISSDPGEPPLYGRIWDEDTVRQLMTRNYTGRWFGNWFWPVNIGKFWFTAYDRTDIMAQTLSDNLYDTKPLGRPLRMRDLNRARPYLVLNATNGTSDAFGRPFTFTADDFALIDSDINDYDLARAVMGTATFPAVFNYMTLKNYRTSTTDKSQYTHIFDGGNVDNLGLSGVSRILATLSKHGTVYDRLVVVLVDAYTGKSGVSNDEADSRRFLDFIVDSNFVDATDSLLSANREQRLKEFSTAFMRRIVENPSLQGKAVYYHIQFADVENRDLRDKLRKIPTNFTISTADAGTIDAAASALLTPQNDCLIAIREILAGRAYSGDPICSYSH
jgi:predicted acylesterase/phospholipase RssA